MFFILEEINLVNLAVLKSSKNEGTKVPSSLHHLCLSLTEIFQNLTSGSPYI